MKKLEEYDWNETILYRPYKKFETLLKTSSSHEFPLIVPPEHHDRIIYPTPKVIFRLFDYTDVPEVSSFIFCVFF
jgi:nuclear cap-binding protein subunit 1